MKKVLISVAVILLLAGGLFYVYLEKDEELVESTAKEASLDEKFRSVYTVLGNAQEIDVRDRGHGRLRYHLTDAGAYIARDTAFEGNTLADTVVTAGEAYVIPYADVDTFEILQTNFEDSHFAKDKNNVYYFGRILEGADAATFDYVCAQGECEYRDANHVYDQFTGEVIE